MLFATTTFTMSWTCGEKWKQLAVTECLWYRVFTIIKEYLHSCHCRLKSERMLLFQPTQRCRYFLSLQMKIVMRNLSMLTPTPELLIIVHVSLQALKIYSFLWCDFWTDNKHFILNELIFIVAALSSTRSNSEQVTAHSEEEDSGASDEVFLYP